MNPKSLVYLIVISCVASLLFWGCGDDEGGPVGGQGDSEVIVKAVTSTPDLGNIVNDPVWDDVDVASIRIGADSTYTNYFGIGIVRVQAIQDGNNFYMRFNWSDSTKTVQPGRWIFELTAGTAFSQRLDTVKNTSGNFGYNQAEQIKQLWENEDMLAVFFEVGNGSIGGNCALSCHVGDIDTTLHTHGAYGNGNLDGWVWRAGRTDPHGVAEDFFVDSDSSSYDASDNELYRRNGVTDNLQTSPRLMHTLGRGWQEDLLWSQDTTTLLLFGPGWQPLDGISGYIYYSEFKNGNASRWDVNAKSEYDPQLSRWTLVLWRSMAAPNPAEDVSFQAGESYEATLAVMKNTLVKHSGSQPFTIKF